MASGFVFCFRIYLNDPLSFVFPSIALRSLFIAVIHNGLLYLLTINVSGFVCAVSDKSICGLSLLLSLTVQYNFISERVLSAIIVLPEYFLEYNLSLCLTTNISIFLFGLFYPIEIAIPDMEVVNQGFHNYSFQMATNTNKEVMNSSWLAEQFHLYTEMTIIVSLSSV